MQIVQYSFFSFLYIKKQVIISKTGIEGIADKPDSCSTSGNKMLYITLRESQNRYQDKVHLLR